MQVLVVNIVVAVFNVLVELQCDCEGSLWQHATCKWLLSWSVRPPCPSVILLLLIIIIIKIYETHVQHKKDIPMKLNQQSLSIRKTPPLLNESTNIWTGDEFPGSAQVFLAKKLVQNCFTFENPWSLSTVLVLEQRACMMFCFKIYHFGSTKQSEPTSMTTQFVLFVKLGRLLRSQCGPVGQSDGVSAF